MGADDYLTKPFGMRELIARVGRGSAASSACRRRWRRPRREKAALQVGDLRLDPEARTARLERRALDLSHTELDLLHLLLRNRGRAFSRVYLRDALRGEAHVEDDRSVDNAVVRLRRKLGTMAEPLKPCGVRAIGFRPRRT